MSKDFEDWKQKRLEDPEVCDCVWVLRYEGLKKSYESSLDISEKQLILEKSLIQLIKDLNDKVESPAINKFIRDHMKTFDLKVDTFNDLIRHWKTRDKKALP